MIQAQITGDDLVADLVLRQGIDKARTYPVPIGTQHDACTWCDGIEISADVRLYVDGGQVAECCRACARSDRVVNAVIEHDTRDGDPHRVTAEIDVIDPPKAVPAEAPELTRLLRVLDRHGHPVDFAVQDDMLTTAGMLDVVLVNHQVVAEFDNTSPEGRAAMLAASELLRLRATEPAGRKERAA